MKLWCLQGKMIWLDFLITYVKMVRWNNGWVGFCPKDIPDPQSWVWFESYTIKIDTSLSLVFFTTRITICLLVKNTNKGGGDDWWYLVDYKSLADNFNSVRLTLHRQRKIITYLLSALIRVLHNKNYDLFVGEEHQQRQEPNWVTLLSSAPTPAAFY